MISGLARPIGTPKMYLDLENRGLINENMLKQAAVMFPQGFADTTMFAIDPTNIPP